MPIWFQAGNTILIQFESYFATMKKLYSLIIICFALCFYSSAWGDTFTHYQTGESFDGYATTETINNKNVVGTDDGQKLINLAEYQIEYNHKGRKNTVAVIPLKGAISSANQAEDFQDALFKEADKGHMAIIIEIDTPGGRVDYAMQIAHALGLLKYCPSIAYICGGDYGGAFSAGAVVSLACDKIYMAQNTVIGAATMIAMGSDGSISDMKTAMGKTVGEKMRSAWRNTMAAMAENNERPGILAKAMEDKDIQVIEITRDGQKMFIDPINKKLRDTLVKTWSKTNQLLTLPAGDAVYCGIGDEIANTREELLRDMNVAHCSVMTNTAFDKATRDFKRANNKINKLASSIDVQLKKLSINDRKFTRIQFARILDSLEKDFKQLKLIKKKYPDVELDEEEIQTFLNNIKAVKSSL